MVRPTKPRTIKLLKGTLRKGRDKGELQTKQISIYPPPPEWIGKYGKAEWHKQISNLKDAGILAECDLTMFETYCREYGAYREALDIIEKQGKVFKTKNGLPLVNPFEYLSRAYLKEARAISAKFGFTPSDRSAIGAAPKKTEDTLEQLQQMMK